MNKIKGVSNPLTIIAIFASITEIVGTIAVSVSDPSNQRLLIWFIILFPVFLVLCFFLVLSRNSRVLYSPSDFKDEGNFMKLMNSTNVAIKENINTIDSELEELKEAILEVSKRSDSEVKDFSIQGLNSIGKIYAHNARTSAKLSESRINYFINEKDQDFQILDQIRQLLKREENPIDLEQIQELIPHHEDQLIKALEEMCHDGELEARIGRAGIPYYYLYSRAEEMRLKVPT